MLKMTENETVLLLKKYCEEKGWIVGDNFCLGQQHGFDIEAFDGKKYLLIEVKGAVADENSPTKKRKQFDSGQIKTHFGKAIVKILEARFERPGCLYAIAHPDDPDIRKYIGNIIPYLKNSNIKHYWVSIEKIIED